MAGNGDGYQEHREDVVAIEVDAEFDAAMNDMDV
jgi:hypothetical protein